VSEGLPWDGVPVEESLTWRLQDWDARVTRGTAILGCVLDELHRATDRSVCATSEERSLLQITLDN